MHQGIYLLNKSIYIHTQYQFSRFYNDINQNQCNTLEEFKKEIITQGLLKSFARYDDRFLLRFLRARKFNLANSIKMLSEYFDWRAKEEVDLIEAFAFPEVVEFKSNFNHGFHHTDKEGRPIYIECCGNIDVKKIFELTTSERWLKYYVREFERLVKYRLRACSKVSGKIIEQTFNITDLSGISLSLLTKQIKTIMQKASEIGQNYYPEILGKVLLINTPVIFTIIFGLIKSFLDPKTVQKMVMLKSNYLAELLQYVDIDKLPERFGGTCHCPCGCFNSNIGPWNPTGESIKE